jgi:Ala-tRNA(Pro) deacylase
MACKERIEAFMREKNVAFEVLTHPDAYTMQEVAAALHVSGRQVAKVVMVKADGEAVMLVVPAPFRLNLDKVKAMLGVKKVSLARESEFTALFPDCLPGAMPPFGHLYGLPVYVEEALAEQKDIVFRVGTHRHTIKLAYADYARLAAPTVAEFAWRV